MLAIEDAPRRDITCQGLILSAPLPYDEGHELTKNESGVMNQTYVENIRNNCHNAIGELVDAAGSLDAVDPKAAQKLIDDYCAKYEFHERKGGGFRSSDPVEAASRRTPSSWSGPSPSWRSGRRPPTS